MFYLSKCSDELGRRHEEALVQQAVQEEERRAALHRDLIHYRTVHQRLEDSRDADLICDPKGALGATIPEAELGPASMQVFQVGPHHFMYISAMMRTNSSYVTQINYFLSNYVK